MDVTTYHVSLEDVDNLSLDLEDRQFEVELDKEESEMIANGEVENPRAGISLVSKDEVKASKNMVDSDEDERAHLSHHNSGKEDRSGRTTEVREADYQH